MNHTNPFSQIVLYLILIIYCQVGYMSDKWRTYSILTWDVSGYHLYLPSFFIHNDMKNYAFMNKIDSFYHPSGDVKKFGVQLNTATNTYVNQYPIGIAVFELPTYAIAHIVTKFNAEYACDGYSIPFQAAVLINNILFAWLGLLILRRFLLRYCTDWATTIVLILIGLGTNFYTYSTMQAGMSHIYGFFLFASIISLTDSWYKKPTFRNAFLIGLCIGMAIIVRPTNVFILFFPLLWGTLTFKKRLGFYSKNWSYLALAVVGCFLPLLLQMAYWKSASGSWIYYSYGEYGFNWGKSMIGKGLFSYRKGWFVYTPLAILGFVGLYSLFQKKDLRFYILPFVLYYAIAFYVLFAWFMWFYGGGFGCRVLIESLSILALPIGLLMDKILLFSLPKKALIFSVMFLLVELNLFQSWQHQNGIIHWDSMNEKFYWHVFMKSHLDSDGYKLINE